MTARRFKSFASRFCVAAFALALVFLLSACADSDSTIVDGDLEADRIVADGDTDANLDGDIEWDDDSDLESRPDPCAPNPCDALHQTRCINDGGGAVCACDVGFFPRGGRCDYDPANDGASCETPIPISPGAFSATTLEYDTAHAPGCVGTWPTGPERIYALYLDARAYARFTLTGEDVLLYLRAQCAETDSELLCADQPDENTIRAGVVLEPGEYSLFVDSFWEGSDFELRYALTPDPCADAPCPVDAQCVAAAHFSDFGCDCGAGKLLHADGCIDDPCDPNPCTDANKGVCSPDDAGQAHCACDFAHRDDGNGHCLPDPLGNEWLVMVYLNADNNLESWGYEDLAEMAAAGYNSRVHVVVLFDSAKTDGGATRRIWLGPDGPQVMDTLDEADMSDGATLAKFGRWAVERFPARKRALILWDHGTGWTKARTSDPLSKGFSEDDHGGAGEISVASGEYSQALSEITDAIGAPLDLVGIDACYMAMFEVALATAPHARWFVASEDQEPNSGWRYDALFGPLMADPEESAEQFGRRAVQVFGEDTEKNDTLSLVDLRALQAAVPALNAFAAALMDAPDNYDAAEALRAQGQMVFLFEAYRDATHIARLFAAADTQPAAVRTAAAELDSALSRAIVSHYSHEHYENAYGLTIYFPGHYGWVHPNYILPAAPWVSQTLWDDFLLDFAGLPDVK